MANQGHGNIKQHIKGGVEAVLKDFKTLQSWFENLVVNTWVENAAILPEYWTWLKIKTSELDPSPHWREPRALGLQKV